MKLFSEIEKLKEFITSSSTLQEKLRKTTNGNMDLKESFGR